MTTNHADPSPPLAAVSRQDTAWQRQAPRRYAEASARRQAALLCEELGHRCGHRCGQVAQRLCVPDRTLRRWRQSCHDESLCQPRGRPCKQSPLADRQAVLDWLDREGCHMGSPSLRRAFSEMPRCEVLDLQHQWREYYRATHRQVVKELTWHKPGRVWAMDHTKPDEPIDGMYPSILCVRDLGSGMQVAWAPVPDETAETTVAVVEALFREQGAPLVVKTDNGSAFISHLFAALLKRHDVAWLPSPPVWPQYNGSCEATNRHAKVRTRHFVQRHYGGRWTAAAVDAARRQANELLCPEGPLGPTLSERWSARRPITTEERAAMAGAITAARHELLLMTSAQQPATVKEERCVQRHAVHRELVDHGLLTVTERLITPPFKLQKAAKIS